MEDEALKVRGDEDAFARMTAIGLLIEVVGLAILAFLAWMFNELSGAEQLVTVLVISVGATGGWLLLIAPKAVVSSRLGRVFLGLVAVVQLALLAVLAAAIVDDGDPRLGIQADAIAFDLAVTTFVVLMLTGCVRAFIGGRPDQRSSQHRRTALRVGLLAALLCVTIGAVAALADTTGIRCATFDFSADQWRSEEGGGVTDRERVADTLVDCHTLIGKTPGEVREMLGRGAGRHPDRQEFFVRAVNSDAQYLIVHYDAGRVRRANLSPPNSD